MWAVVAKDRWHDAVHSQGGSAFEFYPVAGSHHQSGGGTLQLTVFFIEVFQSFCRDSRLNGLCVLYVAG